MSETARTAIIMVASILFPWLTQLADKRFMSPETRARTWNVATWGAALYAFGPASMLGWMRVTRPWPSRWFSAVVAFWIPTFPLLGLDWVITPAAQREPMDAADLGQALLIGSVAIAIVMVLVDLIALIARLTRRLHQYLAASVVLCVLALPQPAQAAPLLPRGATAWRDLPIGAIRGITVGPIENSLHPEGGYGTARGRAALVEAHDMGATWVALTPFARVWDLEGEGLDLTFEAPVEQNTRDVSRAIDDAHALGLRVLLVPHLWVETGGWRALIHPEDDEGWARWAARYRTFLLHWADVAEAHDVEMLSAGVELRRWVTTRHAHHFVSLLTELRGHYSGLVTYSANWDDVEYTTVLGEVDVIGVNAFFPLTQKENANIHDLILGGEQVATDLQAIAQQWGKPIMLTEMGYTTREDPALKPWLWPDSMDEVVIDQRAQAMAYGALLAPLTKIPECAGFFVWRTYADPGDVSQEAEWGFSPRGKLAELILRDAFTASWAADGAIGFAPFAGMAQHGFRHRRWGGHRARRPAVHGWELSPPLTFDGGNPLMRPAN